MQLKATEIHEIYNCKISISTLLEDEAIEADCTDGLDIANYIIAELKSKKTFLERKKLCSPILQSMIDKNKALSALIN